ncbi:hypothetical protein KP509_04G089600 [Ceratopteris richardii]|uniref:Uncharacterized protein n=1 Tax=Ceratopteris richardii TaxID=49495 RepID=A0A8T2UV83_CERRI|nr:hypothetical protein KP509_04G089600 [Ceratopteris richardii]
MGRFAMVWSSRLYELYQIFPHSPTFCTMTTWDAPSCRFLPPSHHRLPLPVDAELLVAGIVHNFILGEPLIHAVIRRGSLLLIGLLGFETLNFDVLVEVEVPNIMLDTDSHFTAEGCWLVNGPVVMVQVHGKVMVVQYSASDRLQCFGTSLAVADIDGDWHALLLNFDDIKMIKGIRFLYFGELGAFQADKMLLSLQISSKAEIAPSCSFTLPGHNDGGFIEGLNFVSISTSEMSHKISKCICNSEKVKELEVLQNLLEVCNDLFPSDICLDLISCICFIPRDSDACYALNLESSYHDVVVGDWSGKITKYRMGAVTAEIDLNNASISIKFAVVAEGQGILLCTADETVGGVSALCAETLHLLKAWEAVEDVVIGDFQMVGHDQLLLLSKSLGSEGLGHYLTPEQLTDMKAQEFIPPVFSVEAKYSHKAEKIRAIADCLRSRMEAGLIQCRGIVDQIVERADLIKSSCVLLQEIANRNSLSLLPDRDDSHMFSPTRQFLDASVLRHGLCGRNLFLVVMVENIVPSDVLLKDVSLSLSMIGGPVSGSTSVIKSLCRTDGKKHLVASVSLMDLPDLSACHIVHVFVNAKVSSTNVASSSIITTTSMSKNAGEMRCLLKIWVGQIDSQDIQIASNLSSLAVPLEIREGLSRNLGFSPLRTETVFRTMEFYD